MGAIDFNKVVEYSKKHCKQKSIGLCATYVKNAFVAGGCKYVSGNGWSNQKFCETNNFVCIGDFVPIDHNPRAHKGMSIQFPEGYVQQLGDICLIQHGNAYGHICYAMGSSIDDWVSDYFQVPPAQQAGTGPYCYASGITRVQFWRHSSVLNDAPVVKVKTDYNDDYVYDDGVYGENKVSTANKSSNVKRPSNSVDNLQSQASSWNSSSNDEAYKKRMEEISRKAKEIEELRNKLTEDAPEMGRDIIYTQELYDSNILKKGQETRTTLY